MKISAQKRNEALAALREILKPGDKVYTVIRSVSKSGMSRCMDVYAFPKNQKGECEKRYLTGFCASLGIGTQSLEMWRRGDGMRVSGCGMDMGFHVVYTLGRMLWPEGNGKFVTGRNGDRGAETDGGYLLKQEWI